MGSDSDGIRYRKLWERSVPLGTALFKFAQPELRRQYEEIEESRFKLADAAGSLQKRLVEDNQDHAIVMLAHFAPVPVGLQQRKHARAAMQDNVIRLIMEDHIRAFGLIVPRRMEDHPWPVPKELWRHRVDWDRERVSGAGLRFIEVRLMPSQWQSKILGELAAPDTANRRSAGRPTVKPFIDEAYAALLAAGHIRSAPSMAVAYDLVRKWLVEAYPDRAGQFESLSNEAIRRQITDRFKADRKN